MIRERSRRAWVGMRVVLLVLVAVTGLAGCGAPGPLMPEQRAQTRSAPPPAPAPGTYRVGSGDTLYSIAFRYGLDWREVARWNDIGAPYTIRVGQPLTLRRPPTVERTVEPTGRPPRPAPSRPSSTATQAPPNPAPAGDSTASEPAQRPPREPDMPPASPPSSPEPRSTPPASSSGSTAPVPSTETRRVGGVDWRWPTAGTVARGFNPGDTRKGILIAGTPGQAVRAAAEGTVVYSGNGLIGYGELIIVKHNDSMLSAYAHNRERRVAEGSVVRAGQQIATLGKNEREESVLHFEIRRNGQPVDPIGFLPRR